MSPIEYCRLCSKRSPANINIFGEQGRRHLIPLKINNIANIFITETDPLPKFVCILCIGKLNFVQNFRTECQNAQTFFRKRLCEILKPESETKDDMNVDCKFRNLFGEIYDEKAEKNKSKNAGSCVNDANTRHRNIENSDDTPNKVMENCNKKVTLISKYADELSEELGVEMEVEEVESDDNFDNFENTTINSGKNDEKGYSIDKASEFRSHESNEIINHNVESIEDKEMFILEKQQVDYDKCNSFKNENSMSLKILKFKIEDFNSDDLHDPNTGGSYAQAKVDESKHVISVSDSVKELRKNNKSSDVKDALDHKSNISQKKNSKYFGFLDSETEIDDCDYRNNNTCFPATDASAAEAEDDENELVVSDSETETETEESSKINNYSDGEDMWNNGNCTNKNDLRTAKVNELPPVVITWQVKENLHDIEELYFSHYENERLNKNNVLFENSYSRYFQLISYIINRKSSVMPYFTKTTMRNNLTRYMFQCFVCKQMVSSNHSAIIRHLILHLLMICKFCNYAAITNNELKEHVNNSHFMQLTQEKIECSYCNQIFSDFDFYWSHIKNHVGERCGLCDFQSKTYDLLLQHELSNHKNDKETCTNCAMFYRFGFADHLKHVRKLGFVCSSCEMAFHNEQHLNMHYKIYGENHSYDKNVEYNSIPSKCEDSGKFLYLVDLSNLSNAKIIDYVKVLYERK